MLQRVNHICFDLDCQTIEAHFISEGTLVDHLDCKRHKLAAPCLTILEILLRSCCVEYMAGSRLDLTRTPYTESPGTAFSLFYHTSLIEDVDPCPIATYRSRNEHVRMNASDSGRKDASYCEGGEMDEGSSNKGQRA